MLPSLAFWILHTDLSDNQLWWSVIGKLGRSVRSSSPRSRYFTYILSSSLPSMAHNNTTVPRTAPIPIAPKPPRPELATHQDSPRRFEIGSVGLHTTSRGSVESSAVSGSAPTNTQPVPPCRSCQYSGTRCILSEDDDGCVPCQVNATDCSLSESSSSPGSRKRKLNGGIPSREISGKRRFVTTYHLIATDNITSLPYPSLIFVAVPITLLHLQLSHAPVCSLPPH